MWRTDPPLNITKIRAEKNTPAIAQGKNFVLDPSRTGRRATQLEERLRRMVVGQDEAIEQIVNIYQMHLTAMNPPGRPVGNFLFLGPTGSGKTRIVEATAEALVNNPRAVVKVDCAEFQHSHEIAKLIGSPPGYLGHRETHPLLSQEVLNQHHTETFKLSFVLFDEIEKASDALWNLLLGILDKGTLTLGDNRKVDFTQTLIFMTSNLGAQEMSQLTSSRLGFSSRIPVQTDGEFQGKVKRTGIEAARKRFTPEFMNRLDKIVVFKPLGEEQLRKILDLELQHVQQRVFASDTACPFVFTATDEVKNHLLSEGFDIKYGARHLKRAIERLLVQPMSNLIATEQVRAGDLIKIDYQDDQMMFLREAEGLPISAMVELGAPMPASSIDVLSSSMAAELPKSQGARSSRRN